VDLVDPDPDSQHWLTVCWMQGWSLPVFTKFDNPGSLAAPLAQGLTTAYLPAFNLLLLLCPAPLCCDWTMGSIPLIHSLSGRAAGGGTFFTVFRIRDILRRIRT
jgi:hypothetical protein